MAKPDELREEARAVLAAAWDGGRGYTFPHASVYPHLWLWDSCFHAIAWAALDDDRCRTELSGALAAQLADGFVPHMAYAGPTIHRGPLAHASSFTQPPVYAHAAAVLGEHGFPVGEALLERIGDGLGWLWEHRMGADGLLVVVHPWETGADDSPRWDSWVGATRWDRERWTRFDIDLLETVTYLPSGAAASSSAFVAAPAAFNALAADAALQLAGLTGDRSWELRGRALAAAIDEHLWDGDGDLWLDRAVVGGGSSVGVPTLDGALPALVTADRQRAGRALARLGDPAEFRAPFGLRYVPASHQAYGPDQYWRGSSWMQLNYLAQRAALRWDDRSLAGYLAAATAQAAVASGFAEHWNPETGEGLGAIPQSWSALVVAIAQAARATSSPGSIP